MCVIDKLALFKTKRVNGNSQEWFDGEVLESIALRDELFKKFKHGKLNVDKKIYNKARNKLHRLMLQKKTVLQKPIKGKCAKPKDLWKTLKSLGLSKKISLFEANVIEDNKRLKYNLKPVAKTFAKFYFNLDESLLKNLPNSSNKFDIDSVHQYYKNIELKDNFNPNLTTERKVLEGLQFIDISKAAGIDKISGRFLKDGANILVKPIARICDISISSGLFPSDCKTTKLKSSYKTGSKTNHENFGPFLSYH